MRVPRSVRRAGRALRFASDDPGRDRSAAVRIRRYVLVVAAFAMTGSLIALAGPASAFPQPTVPQVQHKLAALNARASRLGQEYDQVLQQFSQANERLKLLDRETAGYRGAFNAMRKQVGRIAAVAYEQGGANSPLALLTTARPQQVLNQASILSELSAADSSQIRQYIEASRRLLSARQVAAHARTGILKLKRSLAGQLAVLNKLKAQQQALLAQLTPAQQQGYGPGGGGGGGGYHGPTSTQAEKAVAFAYNQIGCPYVYGGTGPCSAGFDCSGLMMSAWAYAGIQIPRVSWSQMSSLPAVPLHTSNGTFTTQYLQPGDILGFAGNSHVGMYVGGGYLIDAPVPGANVEKVALAGWYLQNLDGAVRP
ncbi:MAG: C40 family peptidase [Streptosporangiaceae bacterium]